MWVLYINNIRIFWLGCDDRVVFLLVFERRLIEFLKLHHAVFLYCIASDGLEPSLKARSFEVEVKWTVGSFGGIECSRETPQGIPRHRCLLGGCCCCFCRTAIVRTNPRICPIGGKKTQHVQKSLQSHITFPQTIMGPRKTPSPMNHHPRVLKSERILPLLSDCVRWNTRPICHHNLPNCLAVTHMQRARRIVETHKLIMVITEHFRKCSLTDKPLKI